MGISAAILGCSDQFLTGEERSFFERVQPWGFILFGRNVDNPAQLSALVSDLKSCVSHEDVPILIDQEGGRVRRLRPPHWPDYHSGTILGDCYRADRERGLRLTWLQSRLMAFDLARLGINVDCLPVLDVPVAGSHDVIGDRAYGKDPVSVAEIGQAACDGLLAGGVLPVIKHIPGHGRACADSHQELPRVTAPLEALEAQDFAPFKQLANMPMAMTAHVVYEAIDSNAPATHSKLLVEKIIRDFIGFDGLLMCDDLGMNALSGDFSERAHSAFAAGCDVVLHCNGDLTEMESVAEALYPLSGDALRRAEAAMQMLCPVDEADEDALRAEFHGLGESVEYLADPTEAVN